MARQRRDQQHARLRAVDVLLEMQQRAERRDMRRLLGHRDLAVADHDAVDAEGRALVGQAGARDQLVGRGQVAERRHGRHAGRRVADRLTPQAPPRRGPGTIMSALGLIRLVEHSPTPEAPLPGQAAPLHTCKKASAFYVALRDNFCGPADSRAV